MVLCVQSGIRIIIRIGKGARVTQAEHENPTGPSKSGKARPNKVQRVARREGHDGEGDDGMGQVVEEEERMNENAAAGETTKQVGKDVLVETSKKQGKTGNQMASGKKPKSGGGKGKPRTSAVAMDVD